jgi:predicted nicotinamide N-methyase
VSDPRFRTVVFPSDAYPASTFPDLKAEVAVAAFKVFIREKPAGTVPGPVYEPGSTSAEIGRQIDDDTIPQILWPAASPFASYLLRQPAIVKGRHVVELGSGTGLGGLAAAAGGANVVLTDMSPVSLAMLDHSVAANPNLAARLSVQQLRWGNEEQIASVLENGVLRGECDMVIGCDIFYFSSSCLAGLRTAAALLQDRGGVFLCGSVARSERMESDLFELPKREGWDGGCIYAADDGSFMLFQWTRKPVNGKPSASADT